MTAREKQFVAQRIVAAALARSALVSDEELGAAVHADVYDMPSAEIATTVELLRGIRSKITDSMARLQRGVGATMELDEAKCACFESELASEHSELDRQALGHLVFWTWYYDCAR